MSSALCRWGWVLPYIQGGEGRTSRAMRRCHRLCAGGGGAALHTGGRGQGEPSSELGWSRWSWQGGDLPPKVVDPSSHVQGIGTSSQLLPLYCHCPRHTDVGSFPIVTPYYFFLPHACTPHPPTLLLTACRHFIKVDTAGDGDSCNAVSGNVKSHCPRVPPAVHAALPPVLDVALHASM